MYKMYINAPFFFVKKIHLKKIETATLRACALSTHARKTIAPTTTTVVPSRSTCALSLFPVALHSKHSSTPSTLSPCTTQTTRTPPPPPAPKSAKTERTTTTTTHAHTHTHSHKTRRSLSGKPTQQNNRPASFSVISNRDVQWFSAVTKHRAPGIHWPTLGCRSERATFAFTQQQCRKSVVCPAYMCFGCMCARMCVCVYVCVCDCAFYLVNIVFKPYTKHCRETRRNSEHQHQRG